MTTATLRHTLAHALDSIFRTVVIGLAVYGGLDLARSALADDPSTAYLPYVASAQEVQTLAERVAKLEDLLVHVSRQGDDLFVTGANLHVVNGEGRTDSTNSLGNVIVGYNEGRADPLDHDDRSGSHMLVVGQRLNYTRFGGIVAGDGNWADGDFACAVGGKGNKATGPMSAVLGGEENEAAGEMAVASGGVSNFAPGGRSTVVGGQANRTDSFLSTAAGGDSNEASEWASSVFGGRENIARGAYAVVSGGRGNAAAGDDSSVGGGHARSVEGQYNWRSGDLFQEN